MIPTNCKNKKRVLSFLAHNFKQNKQSAAKRDTAGSQGKRKSVRKRAQSDQQHCKKKQQNQKKSIIQQKDVQKEEKCQEEKSNPHFLTVADLTSGDFVQQKQRQTGRLHTPAHEFQQQSTLKEEAGVQCSKISQPLSKEGDSKLEQTIGKMKNHQNTMDIFNKTIQTRLVQASNGQYSRVDVHEVEVSFYIDRITELQKQLHQKSKIVAHATEKCRQFDVVARNNKKLISQNHRIRQEKDLLQRQNLALKNLLLKKGETKIFPL